MLYISKSKCEAQRKNFFPSMPETAKKSQKGNLSYKKVRTCGADKNPYNDKYRERNSTLNTEMEVKNDSQNDESSCFDRAYTC